MRDRLGKFTNKKVCVGILSGVAILLFGGYHVALAVGSHAIDIENTLSQSLSISDVSQTGLDLSGNLTIELWYKPESQPVTDSKMALVAKEAGEPEHGYALIYADGAGTKYLGFIVSTDGTNNGGDGLTVNYTLNNNTWYHIAVVYDDTGNEGVATFYVNGTSVGTTSRNNGRKGIYNNSQPFEIGHSQTGPGGYDFADGQFDDVRIWNNTRTATEILNNYQGELVGNESGLVGYWRLNNSLADSTANGNNLINNNSAQFVSFSPIYAVRKSQDETVVSSITLQDDDALVIDLPSPNTAYIISGTLLARTTSGTPDMKIALVSPTNATMDVGYTSSSGNNRTTTDILQVSGQAGGTITMAANTPTVVRLGGTVLTGANGGTLRLQWAQHTSNAATVKILRGSYVKAEPI